MAKGEVVSGISIQLKGNALNPSSFIVPIQIKDGLILVEATVNDQKGSLIIDTGAKTLVLNSKYFTGSDVTAEVAYGLGGAISTLARQSKVTMDIEEINFTDLQADVISLEKIEESKKIRILGLIGYDILEGFETMFNYREGYLTLSQVDKSGEILDVLPHTTLKVDSLTFQLGNFIPVITVDVKGVTKRMGIDTGGEINLLDINRNKDIMSEFQILRTIKISGADGKERNAIAGRMYRIQVFEKFKCAGMSTLLGNLENFDAIYKTKLDGILGYEFLAPWIMSINYRKKKLYIHSFKTERP
ncbi:MAG: aspartyl protease family protein [Saprospiraceae bacterium]|nr:aspartyl protease family protein [Saprospiraceae bacterium]